MESIISIPIKGGEYKKNYNNEVSNQIKKIKVLINIINNYKNKKKICRTIILHFYNLPINFLKPKSIYSDIFNLQLINLYLDKVLNSGEIDDFLEILNLKEPLITANLQNKQEIYPKVAGKINIEYCNNNEEIDSINNIIDSVYNKLCKISKISENNSTKLNKYHNDIILDTNKIYKQAYN